MRLVTEVPLLCTLAVGSTLAFAGVAAAADDVLEEIVVTATWREMAEWQIRAARTRITSGAPSVPSAAGLDPDSPLYYEHLVEALLENVQRDDGKGRNG